MECTEIFVETDSSNQKKIATFIMQGKLHNFVWSFQAEDSMFDYHRIELLQLLIQMITETEKIMVSVVDLGELSVYPKSIPISFHIWKNYTSRSVLFDFGFSVADKMIWTKSLPARDLTTHMKRANIENE